MRKSALIVVLLVVALTVGWLFASPWFAMDGLRDAAREGDSAALAERIDFPALRRSVKDGITRKVRVRAGDRGVAGVAGSAVAAGLADRLVDAVITPQGMSTLLVTGSLIPRPEGHDAEEIDWHVERHGFGSFRAWPEGEDGKAYPALVFHRSGLSWKLVAIDIPEDGIDED